MVFFILLLIVPKTTKNFHQSSLIISPDVSKKTAIIIPTLSSKAEERELFGQLNIDCKKEF